MSVTAAEAKSCCATAYASDAARFLLGDSFHPGGSALTDELMRALDVGRGDVVLDVASGLGTSAERVANGTGCAVVAMDIALAGAATTLRGARGRDRSHVVRGLCGDAEALPLADSSIDGALCECAFCLFPDKPTAAVEIARVLRPGARLVLSDVWADQARLPRELRSLDGHIACLGAALPLAHTARILAGAGLTIELAQQRDDVIAPMLERIAARLRFARLIGGGPLEGVMDRAEHLLAAAYGALHDGTLGYGILIARR